MAWLTVTAIALSTLAAAGSAVYSTQQQNKAAEARQDAAEEAARIQSIQLGEVAAADKAEVTLEAEVIQGRIRVAAGESGIGTGGSAAAIALAADLAEKRSLSAIDRKLGLDIRSLESRIPRAATTSPFLAGALGALGGVSSGLSIASNIKGIRTNIDAPGQTRLPAPRTPVTRTN